MVQHHLSSFLNIVNPSAPCETMPPQLAMDIPFKLDPFQQHAIAAISRHENVLVTAKTGSGKTLVGEYQIAHSLSKGRRVFYTTPIKSLSNQKFHDLKGMFPSVGIMTGDLKFRPDADVVIMTTEILRNLLFKRDSAATRNLGITAELSLEGLDAVVFDECHYINDRDRGAVWEETMILLPPEVNLVLLSATIDAPEAFASWLGKLKKKPIHLISTTYRIVPLQHGVYRGDELLTIMDSKDRFEAGIYNAWLLWRSGQKKAADDHRARVAERRRGGYEDPTIHRDVSGGGGPKSFHFQMNALIGRLDEKGLLPALFFVFSRRDCERYAATVEHTLLSSSDTASVKHILDFHLHRYGEELQRLPQYQSLRSLLEKGIAFHHSGLLPVLKEAVEILFGRGLVRLLFATETFAVGINMPTKTVVFTGYRKYDDATGGMRMLNTDEYIQMAGRAGRRGKDDRGLVLYLPDREPESLEDVKRMMTGGRATFQSRMTFGYEFLLKTLQSGSLEWLSLMRQSYWYARLERQRAAAAAELKSLEAAQAAIGITDDELTALQEREELQEGMRTATNAARRKAQTALNTWENAHMGARWVKLQKELGPQWKKLNRELWNVEKELEEIAVAEEGGDVWGRLWNLARLGFLEAPPAEVKALAAFPLKLTPLGTAATEVNEAHPILMPIVFREKILATGGLSGAQILACLALFLGEGGSEQPPPITSLNLPKEMIAALKAIESAARSAAAVAGESASPFWELDATWVEPVWCWLQGSTTSEVCAEFGLYEGNLLRGLFKMANILEEWRTIATLSADVDMLETMRGLETVLLRGAAVCDSLYLRI